MCKRSALFAAAAALVLAWVAAPASARVDSLSCASVNGVTRCVGSDGLDCRTVDGRMVCAPGSSGSCETDGQWTTCRNGGAIQRFRTAPLPRGSDPSEEKQWPPKDTFDGSSRARLLRLQERVRRLMIEEGLAEPRIRLEQFDADPDRHRLH
jgi:hypothetical protein